MTGRDLPAGHVRASAVLLRYMLLTAARDRLFLALPILLGLGAALVIFLSSGAIIEQREMAAALLGAGSRVLVVLGLILFVCFHVRQAMQGGEIALILSRPLSRGAFVLIYGLSLMLIGALCVMLTVALVWLGARPPLGGLTVWALSLLLETEMIIAVALFFGLILGNAVTASMACLGFYVLARMSGLLAALAGKAQETEGLDQVLGYGFTVISVIIPRLDFFARSEWLVYGWDGSRADLLQMGLQSLVFVTLVLTAAMIDFNRKRL